MAAGALPLPAQRSAASVPLYSGSLSSRPRLVRARMAPRGRTIVTWLILPVVICLSQRLSHACLSISNCTAKLRMAH